MHHFILLDGMLNVSNVSPPLPPLRPLNEQLKGLNSGRPLELKRLSKPSKLEKEIRWMSVKWKVSWVLSKKAWRNEREVYRPKVIPDQSSIRIFR